MSDTDSPESRAALDESLAEIEKRRVERLRAREEFKRRISGEDRPEVVERRRRAQQEEDGRERLKKADRDLKNSFEYRMHQEKVQRKSDWRHSRWGVHAQAFFLSIPLTVVLFITLIFVVPDEWSSLTMFSGPVVWFVVDLWWCNRYKRLYFLRNNVVPVGAGGFGEKMPKDFRKLAERNGVAPRPVEWNKDREMLRYLESNHTNNRLNTDGYSAPPHRRDAMSVLVRRGEHDPSEESVRSFQADIDREHKDRTADWQRLYGKKHGALVRAWLLEDAAADKLIWRRDWFKINLQAFGVAVVPAAVVWALASFALLGFADEPLAVGLSFLPALVVFLLVRRFIFRRYENGGFERRNEWYRITSMELVVRNEKNVAKYTKIRDEREKRWAKRDGKRRN